MSQVPKFTAFAAIAVSVTVATASGSAQSSDIVVIPPDSMETPDASTDSSVPSATDAGHHDGSDGGIEIVRLNTSEPVRPPDIDFDPRQAPDHSAAHLQAVAVRAVQCVGATQAPREADVKFSFALTRGASLPRLREVTNSENLHVSMDQIEILRWLGPVKTINIGQEQRRFRRCLETVRLDPPPSRSRHLSFRVRYSSRGFQVEEVIWREVADDPPED